MGLIKKLFSGLYRDDQGAVIILVALLMVVLLGMSVLAVDVGSLYQTRRMMVNAADAAALAGAQEIVRAWHDEETSNSAVRSRVDAIVKEFAEENEAESFSVSDIYGHEITANSTTVKVETVREAELYFAGAFYSLLGSLLPDSNVSAVAVAEITPPGAVGHLVPLGLAAYEEDGVTPIDHSGVTELWVGDHKEADFGPGNCNSLEFHKGQSMTHFETYLREGYPHLISTEPPNNIIRSKPGLTPNHVRNPVEYRAALSQSIENDDPLILLMPLLKSKGKDSGRIIFEVVGFISFMLDADNPFTGTGAKNLRVHGKFIEYVTVAGTPGSGGENDSGIRLVRLVQ